MGIFDKLRNKDRQLEGIQKHKNNRAAVSAGWTSIEIKLRGPREWDKPDRSGADDVWGRGYSLADDRGLHIDENSPEVEAAGMLVCKVAGVTRRPDALCLDCFHPGEPLTLVRERDNPYDENAVAVFDARGSIMLGYLPKEVAARIGPWIDSGAELQALSLWEWFTKPSGQRVGLKVLIGTNVHNLTNDDGQQSG